jgi:hypothetical protein
VRETTATAWTFPVGRIGSDQLAAVVRAGTAGHCGGHQDLSGAHGSLTRSDSFDACSAPAGRRAQRSERTFRSRPEQHGSRPLLPRRDQKLVACNVRYIELHGLDAKRVRPGVALSEILDMRHVAGTLPAMSKEDCLVWRDRVGRAGRLSETVYEMNNGRIYAIRYRPLANGA